MTHIVDDRRKENRSCRIGFARGWTSDARLPELTFIDRRRQPYADELQGLAATIVRRIPFSTGLTLKNVRIRFCDSIRPIPFIRVDQITDFSSQRGKTFTTVAQGLCPIAPPVAVVTW
ncbi:MAG: hypothetical protein ACI9DF_005955 [Verrucomicrobiales bacterium]|jgi:hypothetical protein